MSSYKKETIEDGLSSAFWRDYLVPEIEKEIEVSKNQLTSCTLEEVAGFQERVRVLRIMLDKPANDLRKLIEEEQYEEISHDEAHPRKESHHHKYRRIRHLHDQPALSQAPD